MEDTINMLFTSWGKWWIFAGVCVSLAIQIWRIVKPHVWEDVSPLTRRIIPIVVAGLGAGAAAAIAGCEPWEIARAVLMSWGAALVSGDLLQMISKRKDAAKKISVLTLFLVIGCSSQKPLCHPDVQPRICEHLAVEAVVLYCPDNPAECAEAQLAREICTAAIESECGRER